MWVFFFFFFFFGGGGGGEGEREREELRRGMIKPLRIILISAKKLYANQIKN